MKILSYKIKGEMIRITTNNPKSPVFVYNKYKFGSKAALKAEIEKNIKLSKKRKDKKEARLSKLESELNA